MHLTPEVNAAEPNSAGKGMDRSAGVWCRSPSHKPVAESTDMTNATMIGRQLTISNYQPIRCVLEMTTDGEVGVIVQPGCSVADVHEMLRLLGGCGGQFDHLTFVDTYEALP